MLLVFAVELIQAFLRKHDVQCLSCFGSMQPSFRKSNIKRFSEKKVPVMVVTDVAARGLDIPLLDYVINFQMSTSVKAFVHRVGRVARNGQTGVAISIVNADELPYLADGVLTHLLIHWISTAIVIGIAVDCQCIAFWSTLYQSTSRVLRLEHSWKGRESR